MRIDLLQQYQSLRQHLIEEKNRLEDRLQQIDQVLGTEGRTRSENSDASSIGSIEPIPRRRARRRGQNTMSMREAVLQALSQGPLTRKEIVGAVQDLGYVFKTSNPLNSIGSVLYGKNTPVKS